MGRLELNVEPGKQVITFTRMFDAPVEKVFRAYVDADAVEQWWGGKTYETKIDKLDARSGGEWRFVQKGPDGNDYGFHGVYHEVTPNKRIMWTFEFEGMPETGHVSLETVDFVDVDGKTRMVAESVYRSVADRDGMVRSGMEKGLTEGLDVLAEIVEKS